MSVSYPQRPKRPFLLGRPAGDLSADELAQVPVIRAEYDAAMVAYREGITAYNKAEAAKIQLLRERCESEFGMQGHKKADLLWSKAWEEGHSGGLQEVYNAYADLVDLAR